MWNSFQSWILQVTGLRVLFSCCCMLAAWTRFCLVFDSYKSCDVFQHKRQSQSFLSWGSERCIFHHKTRVVGGEGAHCLRTFLSDLWKFQGHSGCSLGALGQLLETVKWLATEDIIGVWKVLLSFVIVMLCYGDLTVNIGDAAHHLWWTGITVCCYLLIVHSEMGDLLCVKG